MKKQFYTIAALLVMGFAANAQVGIGTTTPDASSMLDIKSTAKGLLIPRLTTAQRVAVASPAQGLQVYDTTTNSFWYYNGSAWVNNGAAAAQDLRFLGSGNHVSQDAGVGSNGTSLGIGGNMIAIGSGALSAATTGLSNIGIGGGTLAATTTGNYNTALGQAAMIANVNGSANFAGGIQALTANTSGSNNTAVGYLASQSNTTGSNNVTVGVQAGHNITTGGNSIAIGAGTALPSATANNQLNIGNIIYGTDINSGTISKIGINTNSPSQQLTIGSFTTAADQMIQLRTAGGGTYRSGLYFGASGFTVGGGMIWDDRNTTGNEIGVHFKSTTSTAINTSPTRLFLKPDGKVGIGTTTPNAELQLSNNVANRKIVFYDSNNNNDHQFYGFGLQSGQLRYQVDALGASHIFSSGVNATTSNELMRIQGNGNVGVGTAGPISKFHVAADQTSFSNEVAQVVVSGTDVTKKLLLGYNTDTDNGYVQSLHSSVAWTNLLLQPYSGFVGIGMTTQPTSLLHVNGVITATKIQGPSDSRFKKNIKPIENALDKVMQLGGYTYDWKDASEFPNQTLGKGHDMGVIAQEVEKQFPEAVSTNADGYKAVSYTELVPALIEAIKAQQSQIDQLKAAVAKLQK